MERPVTRAQRQFGVLQLGELKREELRKLCHGLLLAEGAVVGRYRTTADYEELAVTASVLWRAHEVIVRIYDRPVTQADLDEVQEFLTIIGALEAMIVATKQSQEQLAPPHGVHLIPPEEIASRITSSALVHWEDEAPTAAIDRLELYTDLAETTALLDPVGIQWLPSLAFNELPPPLVDADVEPQDLLERKVFRLLTACFRFGGIRYGESRRGERLPDAVLYWPDGTPTVAMLDCKAASSGYKMEADHVLRFIRYWETLAPDLEREGRDLRYLVVVSSYFPGAKGDRHSFYSRRDEIEDKTGLGLCYLTASDLAWSAAKIESLDMPLASRARMDWHAILANGVVNREHTETAIQRAAPS